MCTMRKCGIKFVFEFLYTQKIHVLNAIPNCDSANFFPGICIKLEKVRCQLFCKNDLKVTKSFSEHGKVSIYLPWCRCSAEGVLFLSFTEKMLTWYLLWIQNPFFHVLSLLSRFWSKKTFCDIQKLSVTQKCCVFDLKGKTDIPGHK